MLRGINSQRPKVRKCSHEACPTPIFSFVYPMVSSLSGRDFPFLRHFFYFTHKSRREGGAFFMRIYFSTHKFFFLSFFRCTCTSPQNVFKRGCSPSFSSAAGTSMPTDERSATHVRDDSAVWFRTFTSGSPRARCCYTCCSRPYVVSHAHAH